jgi:hypothetical protein
MEKGIAEWIGIDLSYTSPSICVLGDDFLSSKFYFMNSVKKICVSAKNYEGTRMQSSDFLTEMEKYKFVSDWALRCIRPHFRKGHTRISMEGYSFGSTGLVFNIAENGGILKYRLMTELGEFPILVPPKTAKKHYTGNGNANKEAMIWHLQKTENVDIVKHLSMSKLGSPAHDIVDSYAVAITAKRLSE